MRIKRYWPHQGKGRSAALALAAVVAAVALAVAARSPAALATPPADAGPADLQTLTLDSPALGGATHVNVLLPDEYRATAATGRRYPVLYLPNGYTGTYRQWAANSDVVAFARGLPLIVVMPDSGSDWLIDPADGMGPRWEDYVVDELIPYIDAHYRTVAARSGRAVAGLSMGGYGAFLYAARHPDLFVAAASFSGFLDLTPLESLAFRETYPTLAVFGDPQADGWAWDAYNPVALAPNLREVRLYMASGTGQPSPFERDAHRADPLEAYAHAAMITMSNALSAAGITATVDDYGPGFHLWPYFTRDLHRALPVIMDAFADPPPPPSPWSYRTMDCRFTVWGYQVADAGVTRAWLQLQGGSDRGLTVTGGGGGPLTITTARLYLPGAPYRVTVDGARRRVWADRAGRLSLAIAPSDLTSPCRIAIARVAT